MPPARNRSHDTSPSPRHNPAWHSNRASRPGTASIAAMVAALLASGSRGRARTGSGWRCYPGRRSSGQGSSSWQNCRAIRSRRTTGWRCCSQLGSRGSSRRIDQRAGCRVTAENCSTERDVYAPYRAHGEAALAAIEEHRHMWETANVSRYPYLLGTPTPQFRTSNCHNCGAPHEPVCSYCGTSA